MPDGPKTLSSLVSIVGRSLAREGRMFAPFRSRNEVFLVIHHSRKGSSVRGHEEEEATMPLNDPPYCVACLLKN